MNRLPAWSDLVFHVLAHVPSPAPASVFDPAYVAFSEKHLGPAAARPLGRDARVLQQLLAGHLPLATVQLLAWLFSSPADAVAVAHLDLAELPPARVRFPKLLASVQRHAAAAGLLWASALLELEHHDRLPPVDMDLEGFDRALQGLGPVAPLAGREPVQFSRALRLRGRVFGGRLLVGAPCRHTALPLEHAVWQSCHEATVLEVGQLAAAAGARLSHAQHEHAAVVLLAARARRAGASPDHARWLGHFGPRAPSTSPGTLDEVTGTLLSPLLA